VKLWDPREQDATSTMKIAAGNAEVLALSWSAQSHLLAVGSECSEALIYDMRNTQAPLTGEPCQNGHAASVTSVAFSPHFDTLLASGSDDTTFCVAKLCAANTEGTNEGTLIESAHNDTITAIAWHPKHRSMALSVAWDCSVLLWNVELEGDCPSQMTSSTVCVGN